MRKFKSLLICFSFLCGITLLPQFAFAVATFSVDTAMTLEGTNNINLTIRANSEANEVSLGATYMSVEVPIGSTFIVASPANYTLQNSAGFDETCEASARVLTLRATSEVISTVITPVLTTVACNASTVATLTTAERQTTGGVVVIVPVVTPVISIISPTTNTPTAPGPAGGGDGPMLVPPKKSKPDVKKIVGGFIDISDLPTADTARILSVVNEMEKKKTYIHPSHNLFSPESITTAGFAAQVLTGIDGKGCGSNDYPGVTKCLLVAQERGYLPETLTIRSRISRYLFYEALLKALKVDYSKEKVSVTSFKKLCKDYAGSSELVAQVYTAARKAKITSNYYMRNCQLDYNFSRQEAARFVYRAMKK